MTVSATVTNTETNSFTPRPLGLIVLIKAAQHGRSVQSRAGHLIAVKSGSGSEEEEGGEEELERQGKEDSIEDSMSPVTLKFTEPLNTVLRGSRL